MGTSTTQLFQITPVLNTGLSLSEPLQLYKGYNAISRAITGLIVLASWMPHGFDWASIMMTWALLWQNLAKLGKTLAYSGTLWHTLAYSVILWHTFAYSDILWHSLAYFGILLHTLAYSGILWLTLLYLLYS